MSNCNDGLIRFLVDEHNFEEVITCLKKTDVVVVDLETNGLDPYHGSQIIGISLYFPQQLITYYLPFRHGIGEPIDYSVYEKMSNRTTKKRRVITRQLYESLNVEHDNLPLSYLEELKSHWTLPLTHIFHNAKFDLHFLNVAGFPVADVVEDTMLALHLVFEDWKRVKVIAPYTDKKGRWVYNSNGVLDVKEQYANRKLKWMCAYLQHNGYISNTPSAAEGEDSLYDCMEVLEEELKSTFKFKSPLLDIKADMWMLEPSEVYMYAQNDSILTYYLREWCMKQLTNWDNVKLWNESCDILRNFNFRMEVNGVHLDTVKAKDELMLIHDRLIDCREVFYSRVANHSISSPVKLKQTLQSGVLAKEYSDLLPDWVENNKDLQVYSKYTVSNTSKETLEKYKDHPIVRLVMAYRKLKKSWDYLTKWVSAVDDEGIVRNNMSMDGTVSGRFSSWGNSGNWQNIPDRDGYTIKRAIVSGEDEYIIAIDYAQLEARIASYIAESMLVEEGVHANYPTMSNLFKGIYNLNDLQDINPVVNIDNFMNYDKTIDIHNFTKEVLDIRYMLYGKVTDEQILLDRGYVLADVNDHAATVDDLCRFFAKTLNFGLLYSGSPYMVARHLRVELEAAKELHKRWHKLFPSFSIAQEYYENLSLQFRKQPASEIYSLYATQPITGRHRRLKPYSTKEPVYKAGKIVSYYNKRSDMASKVWNNIVQGIGGHLLPLAMTWYGYKYGWEGVKPFALIHDAIELRVQKTQLEKVNLVVAEMVDFDINPKLDVSISIGSNWQDMKEIEGIVNGYPIGKAN